MSYSEALGIMEIIGLPAAIACADAAVKAANVRFLGYELTKGGGWVTVKVTGNVSAVQAAVAAGAAAASKVNSVAGVLILPRPHEEIEKMIYSADNVYYEEPTEPGSEDVGKESEVITEIIAEETQDLEAKILEIVEAEPEIIGPKETPERADTRIVIEDEPEVSLAGDEPALHKATCNLCGDPACPRGKGSPRKECIHCGEIER